MLLFMEMLYAYDYDIRQTRTVMYVVLTVIKPYIPVRPFLLYIGRDTDGPQEDRSDFGTRLSYNAFELKRSKEKQSQKN